MLVFKPAKVRSTCTFLLPKTVHRCCHFLYILIYRKLCIANCQLQKKDERQLGGDNPYSTVLLHECNGDEEKAFDKFFEYLDEFKKGQRAG